MALLLMEWGKHKALDIVGTNLHKSCKIDTQNKSFCWYTVKPVYNEHVGAAKSIR